MSLMFEESPLSCGPGKKCMAEVHIHDHPHTPGLAKKVGSSMKIHAHLKHVKTELDEHGRKVDHMHFEVHKIDGLGSPKAANANHTDHASETRAAFEKELGEGAKKQEEKQGEDGDV